MEYRQGKATTEDLKSWLHTANSESVHQDEKTGNIIPNTFNTTLLPMMSKASWVN